ncbi:MAG TPA: D-2-hydroxyacid dehydrogenase family protein [Candidatus Binatia bacterium]|nr:D-2-hydroxyacid dehydrogenase family protein [Candidatus Binatia bacterium]
MQEPASEKIRVVILDDYEGMAASAPSFDRLKARTDLVVMRSRLKNEAELGNALREAQIILLMRERTRLSDKELSLAPVLKFIAQTGKTTHHLDLAAINRRGIAVSVTLADNANSTIELTMALILNVMRQISLVDRKMRTEAWPAIPGRLLEEKTVGIVGLGRIGSQVARLCQAFKARVVASGKTLTDERAQAAGATRVELEALLRQSDVVTIHVPLRPETRDLIGEKELALMKPGAFLINTARGPIVSQAALVRALEQGHLGGAGLDVYDEEPLPFDNPLRRFDNVVLLPHRGYATVEVLRERFDHAIHNILSYLDGKPTNVINAEVLAR